MASIFESATRAAIEEILNERLFDSKHGYVLTKDGYAEIVDEFYRFLQTSRELKEVGDKMIGGVAAQTSGRRKPANP